MSIDRTTFVRSQAWLLFQLNDAPVCTASDGDFNVLAIMDVATGVIFGMEFVALEAVEPSEFEARKLFASAESEAGRRPDTLFVSREKRMSQLIGAAEAMGVEVMLENEESLDALTREAREGFMAHVNGTRTQ